MKFVKFLPFIALVSLIVLGSCKKDTPQTLIVSKWTLSDWILAPGSTIPDSIRTKMVNKSFMEFTAEKTFVFTGNDNAQSKGTYTISDDGKFLTLMPENSDATFIDTIREISATRLVLIDKNGNQLVNTK